MKKQTLKHLTIILNEYEKGQSQLEFDLTNDKLNEFERLEKNSDLIEISSRAGEVRECISWIKTIKEQKKNNV